MTLLGEVEAPGVARLLARFGLDLVVVDRHERIPGTYWGEPEAGLLRDRLFARADTPLHSVLHEACHYVCMTEGRRVRLERDAGGDDVEESAVCYLQVLLADELPELGRERLFRDMDEWGYSFRLGSTRRWFEEDAEDARSWLVDRGLLTPDGDPRWRVRLASTSETSPP